MEQPTTIRRTVTVVEFTDADALVTVDEYDRTSGQRTAQTVYRTSAAPAHLREPLAAYLLSDELPACLALHPDATEAVMITRGGAQDYTVTLYRSLRGDTTANALASSLTDDLDIALARVRDYLGPR